MAKTTGTLASLTKYFSDEDSARAMLESLRWPDGAVCPHCGGDNPYKLTPKATSKRPGRKGLYKCRACRKQFTVTVGTIFEGLAHSHFQMVDGDPSAVRVEETHVGASASPDVGRHLPLGVVHGASSASRDEG